jgi:uncharacterized protein YhbP (UPF0306 family)
MNLNELALEYFHGCKLMQLATISEGNPWICSVYFAIDDDMNIYWTSAKNRQHSREIMSNPKVAVTVVKDPEHKQALQITGVASIVPPEDITRVNKLYGDKLGHKPERLEEVMANNPEGRAYWMIKPTTIYFWDEVNFPNSPKQQLPLK